LAEGGGVAVRLSEPTQAWPLTPALKEIQNTEASKAFFISVRLVNQSKQINFNNKSNL
jgi:hypothetical protein